MKNVMRSLPWKIFCFFLCVVMAIACVGGIVGTVILSELDFYTYTQEQTIENIQYEMVQSQVDDVLHFILMGRYTARDYAMYAPERTNLRFLIMSAEGTQISTNLPDQPTSQPGVSWQFRFIRDVHLSPSADSISCTFYGYLEPDLPVQDQYRFVTDLCRLGYLLRYWLVPIAIAALILGILCWISLLCAAGRRPRSDSLHPGFAHRLPFDVLVAATGLGLAFCLIVADNFHSGEAVLGFLFAAVLGLLALCTFLGLSMSLATRIKAHTLVKNTLIWRVLTLCRKLLCALWRLCRSVGQRLMTLVRSLPLIWRTGLGVLCVGFLDFSTMLITAVDYEPELFLLWLLVRTTVLGGIALYAALFMRTLQKGGQALARGELSHRVDTTLMFWDFKAHGENLNQISQGMRTAVEEQLQSERLKTELITNVSHDIKTPLTSIINYATLIGEETCNSENHATYAEVLVRKSEQLKRLLDDLVEASKAATGNLEVQLSPCDAGVLLNQASGEFQQRCQDAGLELIVSQPEAPIRILADSRRIWRVFENLLGNACKYSLPGSRVFLSLTREGTEAVFTFRNTSKAVLNVTPRELMERFVRGDSARSTEGSGLGLSIAQSLTQLQGGKMDVTIDADLFRVTLRFPITDL